jgi:hypothetical protein
MVFHTFLETLRVMYDVIVFEQVEVILGPIEDGSAILDDGK